MTRPQIESTWDTYRLHRRGLVGYAQSLLADNALAEDAVHDAVVEVVRSNTAKRDLKAYLFRAVRNRALRLLSLSGREVPASNGQLTSLLEPKRADADLIEEESAKIVVQQLGLLGQDEREVIFLHLYGDLKFREVATLLNAPLGTITARYRRGIEKLGNNLEMSTHET